MGGELDYVELDGGIDKADLQAEFETVVEQRAWDHGHGGYTGTLAEKEGMTVEFSKVLYGSLGAVERALENTDKWGPPLACRYTDRKGNSRWVVGGWCSS
jgi:hypothetical protein|tara:strand:- start:1384 stop:1683 length:300 start_codon:yes stop_codon:yes gene_type:complete